MRTTLALATTAVTMLSLAACGSDSGNAGVANCTPAHQFSTIAQGTLTVSVFDLPPFTKVEQGKITGVDGELLDEIAKRECLTVTATPMDAPGVIPAVQNGRADVAAGDWYRTEARAKVVTLSAPMYTDQMGVISADGTTSIPSLKGKQVGTVDGYLWVEDLQTYLGANLHTYPSSTAMWQDLQAGRIEIGVDSYASATYVNQNTAQNKFKIAIATADDAVAASKEAAQSAFPTSKANSALSQAIDADIAAMKQDGTIARILQNNGLDASAADTGDPRLIP